MTKLLYFLIIILSAYIAQKITRVVIRCLNKEIKDAIPKLKEYSRNQNLTCTGLDKEVNIFYLLEDKKKEELGFITRIIGWFEAIVFATLAIIIINNSAKNVLDIIKFLGIAASGWIALKIFGNYQQWSGAILGRSVFYIFLIGSIINILVAVVMIALFYLLIQNGG